MSSSIPAWGTTRTTSQVGSLLSDVNVLRKAVESASSLFRDRGVENVGQLVSVQIDNRPLVSAIGDLLPRESETFREYATRVYESRGPATCTFLDLAMFGGWDVWRDVQAVLAEYGEADSAKWHAVESAVVVGMDSHLSIDILALRHHVFILAAQGDVDVCVGSERHSLGLGDCLYVPSGAQRSIVFTGAGVASVLSVTSDRLPSPFLDAELKRSASSVPENESFPYRPIRLDSMPLGPPEALRSSKQALRSLCDSPRLSVSVALKHQARLTAFGIANPPRSDASQTVENWDAIQIAPNTKLVAIRVGASLVIAGNGHSFSLEYAESILRVLEKLIVDRWAVVDDLLELASVEDLEEAAFSVLDILARIHVIVKG